jgi:hypothetical protein
MEIPRTITLLQPILAAEQQGFPQQQPIEEELFITTWPLFPGKN